MPNKQTTQQTTQQTPTESNIGSLLALSNLMFGGGKTTTSGGGFTQTEQTALSPEAVQALVKNVLGTSGYLAEVGAAGRGAGIYNSAVTKLLSDNLMAQVTANVAEKAAPKTITRSGSDQVVKQDSPIGKAGPYLTAAMLAKSLLGTKDKKTGKSGLDKMLESVKEIFRGTPTTSAAAVGASAISDLIGGAELSSFGVDEGTVAVIPGFTEMLSDAAVSNDMYSLMSSFDSMGSAASDVAELTDPLAAFNWGSPSSPLSSEGAGLPWLDAIMGAWNSYSDDGRISGDDLTKNATSSILGIATGGISTALDVISGGDVTAVASDATEGLLDFVFEDLFGGWF